LKKERARRQEASGNRRLKAEIPEIPEMPEDAEMVQEENPEFQDESKSSMEDNYEINGVLSTGKQYHPEAYPETYPKAYPETYPDEPAPEYGVVSRSDMHKEPRRELISLEELENDAGMGRAKVSTVKGDAEKRKESIL
jgi:hypothetical protein